VERFVHFKNKKKFATLNISIKKIQENSSKITQLLT